MKSFKCGWAKRPKHGTSKGKLYMTDEHKQQSQEFLEQGENDKGMKMSAALMLEAMRKFYDNTYTGEHPHPKHYLPFVSEITVVINQL